MAKKKTEKPQRQLTRRQLSQYQKQQRRQRFIFIGGITIIAVIVILVFTGWLAGEFLPMHATVIKVGENEYNMQYYVDTIKLYVERTGADLMTAASSAATLIQNNALVIMDAEEKGITVGDEEAREILARADSEINDASIDFEKARLVSQRVREEHFAEQVPISDNQVNVRVMLLESETRAAEIRDRLSSENFSALATEFSLHASTNATGGEAGWHPGEILEFEFGSSVPVEYAFGAEAGDLSRPLYDEEVYKQVGYWLINVQEKTGEGTAILKLVLLGSEEEAEDIRARILTTGDVTALIEEYSQHAASRTKGGEYGPVSEGEMSQTVDAYVFGENVETGVWSQPIRDDTVSTEGGYWLVEVIDKENDRELSEEDREILVYTEYYEWFNSLMQDYADLLDISNLTPDRMQEAIKKAREGLD